MIPLYSRVVAIDDVESHLQKIIWGLGKAGFSALPFSFEDGKLESPPERPLPGIRVVFSDIHLVGGGLNNEKTHAANIIRCLRQIVAPGPYVLIFWSQFPGDSNRLVSLIQERAEEAGLVPPIGYAAIDKNEVFNIDSDDGDEDFKALKLRELILEKLREFKTLAIASSWEERTARAAAKTTDRIFQLIKASDDPTADWEALLGFLACEAVGQHNAKDSIVPALDAALLPLLEDQLLLIGNEPIPTQEDIKALLDVVSKEKRACPPTVAKSQLNASYLIEELSSNSHTRMWARGTATTLGVGFINSGLFVRAFGHDDTTLIRREFATRDLDDEEKKSTKLHVVELGPECDHVQNKLSTHRYLLALLVPATLIGAFTGGARGKNPPTSPRYRNDSVIDIGKIQLNSELHGEWHLLISCRCFMALAKETEINGKPRFRLRRALMDEVAHRYTTHVRRPGVMRFHD